MALDARVPPQASTPARGWWIAVETDLSG